MKNHHYYYIFITNKQLKVKIKSIILMLVPLMFIILGVNFSNILGCSVIRHFLLQHLDPFAKRAQHLMNQKGNNGHYINRCYDICIYLHNETSTIYTIEIIYIEFDNIGSGFYIFLVFCCILRKNCSRKSLSAITGQNEDVIE